MSLAKKARQSVHLSKGRLDEDAVEGHREVEARGESHWLSWFSSHGPRAHGSIIQ
jgi:hypothetical protein